MMTPGEEAHDLVINPLPEEVADVLLGLADKAFGKSVVDLCSQTPVTERWEVKRK